MKNKTLATWITFLFGPLGFHRFYLFGWRDALGWLHPIPTALGLYGFVRVRQYGLDDPVSWWLLPLFGFLIDWDLLERHCVWTDACRTVGTNNSTRVPTLWIQQGKHAGPRSGRSS